MMWSHIGASGIPGEVGLVALVLVEGEVAEAESELARLSFEGALVTSYSEGCGTDVESMVRVCWCEFGV